ncbi:MAG: saccharopine dehydrogenase family protein [Kiritimatiellia bacterium]
MGRVLIIGAGGVGNVVVRKCAQLPDVFEHICLASRTKEKCDRIAADLTRPIETAAVDADNVSQLVALIERVRPDVVINVALPYQDLHIMEACLQTRTHYIDTANYESPELAHFEYREQWNYHDRYRNAGIMAVLGCGFDPGVTNAFIAFAHKHHFDEIHEVNIIDCNAGDHGLPFATNFNPEINIREVTAKGRYWENGRWVETEPLEIHCTFDFPEDIGKREIYLLYHEELESLVKHFPNIRRLKFWMTFSQSYLTHLRVLQNLGLTSIKPIKFQGVEIVPLQFLKALLPDPATLGARTKGKTCIGCWITGVRVGVPKKYRIYNVCDHEECYREVQAQAVSYTAGVPPVIAAMLMIQGVWKGAGVFNVEQLDPDPFLELLDEHGLPWKEQIL